MNAAAAESVDWLPALSVLAIGLFVGAVLAWRALATARRARVRSRAAQSVQLGDLGGKRDALLRQLQELDDTASKRTPLQLAQERYSLELQAAHALLALDEAQGVGGRAMRPETGRKSSGSREQDPQPEAPQTAMRGFLWGMGSATAVLLLGFFVYLSAKPRETGGSVTGNLPAREESRETATTGEEAELKATIERNPENLEARLALAQFALQRREYMNVWKETGKVLEREPGNPRALAYQAVVRLAMGQTAVAVEMLQKATKADPSLVDARAYLALAYARLGKMPAARATIAEASRQFPDRAAELKVLLADLQKEEVTPAAAVATAGAGEDPHAGVPPAPGAPRSASPAGARGGSAMRESPPAMRDSAPAMGDAAPATSGRRVAGTIVLDPGLESTGGVLFVFVKNAHATGGPPIAVKRLPAIFPATFELGQADSMMGQEFPEHLSIEARLDSDGDPTTRAPTDPKARLDDVAAGRTDLRLVLKRP